MRTLITNSATDANGSRLTNAVDRVVFLDGDTVKVTKDRDGDFKPTEAEVDVCEEIKVRAKARERSLKAIAETIRMEAP